MRVYVGLDVSMHSTSVCVVDQDGTIVRECKPETDPGVIAQALKPWTGDIERVGLEAQSFSPWLAVELLTLGLPAMVVEAVHMQKALSA